MNKGVPASIGKERGSPEVNGMSKNWGIDCYLTCRHDILFEQRTNSRANSLRISRGESLSAADMRMRMTSAVFYVASLGIIPSGGDRDT